MNKHDYRLQVSLSLLHNTQTWLPNLDLENMEAILDEDLNYNPTELDIIGLKQKCFSILLNQMTNRIVNRIY